MLLVLFVICIAIYPLNLHAEEDKPKDSVFLCTEMPVDSLQRRMVYGYIDGEKTDCMTENRLLSLLSEKVFRHKQDSILAEKKKSHDYYLQEIARGEKDLRGAPLRMTDLMEAKLKDIDFTGADLSSADLREADLSGAVLRNADLTAAFCKNAVFSGADLSGVILDGTYLNGADLTDVKGLTYESLSLARTIYDAKISDSMLEVVKQNAPHLLEKPKEGWIKNTWAPDSLKKNK